MGLPLRNLIAISALLLGSAALGSSVPAKEYQWENYSETFKKEMRISTGVDVLVSLPAELLAEINELKLVIEHAGIGNDGSGTLRGLLTVNNQSFWKAYSFGNNKFTDDPIELSLKAKDFKSGINNLRFSSQRSGNTVRGWYTITALRFDLPLAKKDERPAANPLAAQKSENQKLSTPSQPATAGTHHASAAATNAAKRTRAPSTLAAPKSAGSSATDFGAYHALVIGNNNYQHIAKLKTAVQDAKAVAQLLQQKYNFKVSLLLNATRSEIFLALSDMRKKLSRVDNLLVYYAGHGNIDKETQRGYWLPINAERSNKANWIANEDITGELKAIKAKHVLIIADSCYSGTLTRGPGVMTMRSGTTDEWVRRMATRQSRTVLTSGALEPVLDAGGGDHSVFAQAFLRTFQENDQIIDMDSLYEKIRRRVVLNARQTPLYSDIRFAGHDDGDFIFVPR